MVRDPLTVLTLVGVVLEVRLPCTLLRTSPTQEAGMFMVEWEGTRQGMAALEWPTSTTQVSI